MRFKPHPFLPNSTFARWNQYSFAAITLGEGQWEASYQNQLTGGSASNTREGPFESLAYAEEACEQMRLRLKFKGKMTQ